MRAKATGANVDALVIATNDRLDLADVGLKSAVGLTVRVRNIATEGNTLAANAAFCHFDTS